MRRILMLGVGLAALAGMLAGCGDEDPTAVGSELIGPGFTTYEVTLDAERFLVSDTTYDRFGSLSLAPFQMVAAQFEGEVDIHTLFRVLLPNQVSYEDSEGVNQTDSVFTIVGGTLTAVVDTLRSGGGPVDIEVVQLLESWHGSSATWELRVDTADAPQPWAVPGGTPGTRLATATWESGDTLAIAFDSAGAAAFADSAGAYNGGMIRAATSGTRLRFRSIDFEFDVIPSASPDTVVQAGGMGVRTVVAAPDAPVPAPEELRVGGLPAWRSALRFSDLQALSIPCSTGAGCTVPLSDVTINHAALLLEPLPVGGRRIEGAMRVEGRGILGAAGVPLTRSPLTLSLGRMADSLVSADFTASPPETATASVPVTRYVQQNLAASEDGPDRLEWLALTAVNEQIDPLFGYAVFGSLRSASPPRLHLIVTVPTPEVTR